GDAQNAHQPAMLTGCTKRTIGIVAAHRPISARGVPVAFGYDHTAHAKPRVCIRSTEVSEIFSRPTTKHASRIWLRRGSQTAYPQAIPAKFQDRTPSEKNSRRRPSRQDRAARDPARTGNRPPPGQSFLRAQAWRRASPSKHGDAERQSPRTRPVRH